MADASAEAMAGSAQQVTVLYDSDPGISLSSFAHCVCVCVRERIRSIGKTVF